MWSGRYNSLQTDFKDLVKSNQNVIGFTIFRLKMNRTRYDNVDDAKIKNGLGEGGDGRWRRWGDGVVVNDKKKFG